MSELSVNHFTETHEASSWLIHETTIILNTVYFSLLFYYNYYEVLSWLFYKLGYPHLPTLDHLGQQGYALKTLFVLLALIGALLGVHGSASWKLGPIIFACLISIPFVLKDIYLYVTGCFHLIDPDNFLLFQTLFTTTFRSVRFMTLMVNLFFAAKFNYNLPEYLRIWNFI